MSGARRCPCCRGEVPGRQELPAMTSRLVQMYETHISPAKHGRCLRNPPPLATRGNRFQNRSPEARQCLQTGSRRAPGSQPRAAAHGFPASAPARLWSCIRSALGARKVIKMAPGGVPGGAHFLRWREASKGKGKPEVPWGSKLITAVTQLFPCPYAPQQR